MPFGADRRAAHGRDRLRTIIAKAFAGVERPGNRSLRGRDEVEEAHLVEEVFADKDDWRLMEPAFLDEAPAGFSTALNFLSDEAFRYFLPAYLLADLYDRLDAVDPVFHLTHGLGDDLRDRQIDAARFGDRTWFDEKCHRFSVFTAAEAQAIVGYLEYRADGNDFDRARIAQALAHYWAPGRRGAVRAAPKPSAGHSQPGRDVVKRLVADAFADIERPGDWALRGSNEGDEPFLVERAFADKQSWRTLDAAFLDTAPAGLASALCFLSDEALRYFLPAYLLADLDGKLVRVDPAMYLSLGFDRVLDKVDARRFGDRTWLDALRYRYSVFTQREARAILAYLEYRLADRERFHGPIEPAIAGYWRPRVEAPGGR